MIGHLAARRWRDRTTHTPLTQDKETMTTVQQLVDSIVSREADRYRSVSGLIAESDTHGQIAATVHFEAVPTGNVLRWHLETIEYEPAPDVVISEAGDYFTDSHLESAWSTYEDATLDSVFDDMIRASGVSYVDPDTEAKWVEFGNEEWAHEHEYWIDDVTTLTEYIKSQTPEVA